MNAAWVIGSGGLLGRSLCSALQRSGQPLFQVPQSFDWQVPHELERQVEAAVDAFAARARRDGRWEIYWAAGIGTMGSREADLAPETAALITLLARLQGHADLGRIPGTISFASSAGAIFAGSSASLITESSEPSPTTPYAWSKLHQESLVRAFVERMGPNTRALMARISTLYGAGQAQAKTQGLITHVARQIVRNRPLNIYVPLDTIRDYIAVEDAVAMWIGAAKVAGPGTTARIIASGRPTTIAEIVSIFRRISRRRLPIVTAANRRSAAYSRCIQFRSQALPLPGLPPSVPLPVGISRVLAAERAHFAQGH